MRLVHAVLGCLLLSLASVSPAFGAKTYNDPWLEGDLQQIRVPGALDILARTPQHVIVGDVDSGARLNDPDLAPHLMPMPTPFTCADAFGPGTAGIIAAVPNNGIEAAGVAPNARVLPVRACYGNNPDCFEEPALDAF